MGKKRDSTKTDFSSFMCVILMLTGALVTIMISNVVIIAANPENVQIMPRSQFKDMELSPGLLVIFNDAANAELPGVVKAFDDEQVSIDFNHPLAGKALTFDVEIIEVKAL